MSDDSQAAAEGRCTTGIEGLDEILAGGLPKHRLYLIRGDPGVGKTTVALQFLLAGARLGETSLYITLSETKEELTEVADSHGWDLGAIHLFELSAMEEKLQGETQTFFYPSDVELNRTTNMLLEEVERVQPSRVVFDSLSEMRMLAETPLRYRRQVLQLKQYFAGRKRTVVFLDDRSGGHPDLQVESVAHGVIDLHRSSPDYGASRRYLNVLKIRGVNFREGNHDMILRTGGMTVFPRLVAAEHRTSIDGEAFPSGIAELDALLGGGLDRGTSNMLLGPPGTGKSTLAVQFAVRAATQGDPVLFFTFDETRRTLLRRSSGLGMDLEPLLNSGVFRIEQVDPAEIAPGEFVHRIRCAVTREHTRMVVIDSINGYLNAMPEERHLTLQLHELLAYLNHQGVITIMILAQQGLVGHIDSRVDLTYLADTVLMLRFFESRGEIKQALSVVKKRSGNHERTIREMKIGRTLQIGPPLVGFRGVLTGVPALERDGEQTLPHT